MGVQGGDSDEGKPIVEFNKNVVTEVSVGPALSPAGKVKTFRGHVLFNPKKTVILIFMEPEKMCFLRTRTRDNRERLLGELGQYTNMLLTGFREMKEQGFSLTRTKSSGKSTAMELYVHFILC